ncbi:cytochrome P450 [Daedalea quercina L-15889]|uniref:Cytochrome P450 n=1 Tax=Daedalea quercina L-15889 TaxID=1314783 RepID=A0A165LQ98_9APHY|nr:cytochrome P450 [Daedalea quercina L-15889]
MAITIAVFLSLLTAYVFWRLVSRKSLPPGPTGLPFIGNTLQMPKNREWVAYGQLAKKYGDVMHMTVLGKSIIVLTSREAILDLLEKKGTIYADRPIIPMGSEMIGYSRITILCPYGTRLKESRKLITNAVNARSAPDIHRVAEVKILRLLPKLLASPTDFKSHLRWFIAGVVLQITHGHDVQDLGTDPLCQLAGVVNAQFSAVLVPGKFLVDSFPLLRYIPAWFPGAGFKAFANDARRSLNRLLDEPYNQVKEQITRGTATESFTSKLIENNPNPSEEELLIYKMSSTQFYAAGADTTASSLESLFLILALYPEVQRKAQAELDALLGSTRLPKCSDRDKLPYVSGLVKEVHRWIPVFPLAIPHKVMQDDMYKGYHIPKGATVVANSWAVLHDPSIYPDPFEVKPERYLNQKIEDVNPDPVYFAFGYGRRYCPGRILADDMVFIVAATILATFNVTNARSLSGESILKDVQSDGGSINHPPPFTCTVTPRSADVAHFISNSLSSHN